MLPFPLWWKALSIKKPTVTEIVSEYEIIEEWNFWDFKELMMEVFVRRLRWGILVMNGNKHFRFKGKEGAEVMCIGKHYNDAIVFISDCKYKNYYREHRNKYGR